MYTINVKLEGHAKRLDSYIRGKSVSPGPFDTHGGCLLQEHGECSTGTHETKQRQLCMKPRVAGKCPFGRGSRVMLPGQQPQNPLIDLINNSHSSMTQLVNSASCMHHSSFNILHIVKVERREKSAILLVTNSCASQDFTTLGLVRTLTRYSYTN